MVDIKPLPTIERACPVVVDYVPIYYVCEVMYILINAAAVHMPSVYVSDDAIFQR